MSILLSLDQIRIDGGTQQRAAISDEAVADYAAAYEAGTILPPVVVVFDGADHWLADGFHRYHAAAKAGLKNVPADIRTGSRRDAVLLSVSANAEHGLRRTNADKRKAVLALLGDEEWATWSDRQIAKAVFVSVPFVGAVRRPQVEQKQRDNRTASAAKVGHPACNPITPLVGAQLQPVAPADDLQPLPEPKLGLQPLPGADAADAPTQRDAMQQLAHDFEVAIKDNALMGEIFDSDDRLKAAFDKVKQQELEIRSLRERMNGLMNEKNEAIRLVKSLRRQVKALEGK